MPAPVSLSSLKSPNFLFPDGNCPPAPELTASAAFLDSPLLLVLTLGGTGKPLLPDWSPLPANQEIFLPPNMLPPPSPRAMFMVLLVAACCCASVALASACRLASFLVMPFLTSTSGARSPTSPLGVPGADVPITVEPALPPSPDKLALAFRRARFANRASSAARSS